MATTLLSFSLDPGTTKMFSAQILHTNTPDGPKDEPKKFAFKILSNFLPININLKSSLVIKALLANSEKKKDSFWS